MPFSDEWGAGVVVVAWMDMVGAGGSRGNVPCNDTVVLIAAVTASMDAMGVVTAGEFGSWIVWIGPQGMVGFTGVVGDGSGDWCGESGGESVLDDPAWIWRNCGGAVMVKGAW